MDKEILKAFEKVLDQHSKQLLTIDEACEYINYEKSYVYKLTSQNKIPFIKPRGRKFLYFRRSELDEWLAGGSSEYQKSISETENWVENIISNISTNG